MLPTPGSNALPSAVAAVEAALLPSATTAYATRVNTGGGYDDPLNASVSSAPARVASQNDPSETPRSEADTACARSQAGVAADGTAVRRAGAHAPAEKVSGAGPAARADTATVAGAATGGTARARAVESQSNQPRVESIKTPTTAVPESGDAEATPAHGGACEYSSGA